MKKTDIYIGLNDQDTKVQKFETEKYVSVLKRLCIAYKVPFSFSLIDGGYIHDSGEYTQEKTLVLTLIDADKNIIEEIAKDLCVFFHIHHRGIGSKLLDIAEQEAARFADHVFLAVGVHSGYGRAQRIYVSRGYNFDGSGVWYKGKQLEQYAECCNDDDLLLFMSKPL